MRELPIRGVTFGIVQDAVENADKYPGDKIRHDLKVAYELLLDEKRHKKRIEDVVMARRDSSSTPPGTSPRIHGIGISPGTSLRDGASVRMDGIMGPAARPNAALAALVDSRDLSNRRRR